MRLLGYWSLVLLSAGACSTSRSTADLKRDGAASGMGGSTTGPDIGLDAHRVTDAIALPRDAMTSDGGRAYDAPKPDAPQDAVSTRDGVWWIPEASNGCRIVIAALAPGNLVSVVPSPSQILRVQGQVVWGNQPAFEPTWTWKVVRSDGVILSTTQPVADPSVAEFPVTRPGRYDITATVGPSCMGLSHALAPQPQTQFASYRMRVIPPGNLVSEITDNALTTPCPFPVGGKCPVPYEVDLRVEANSQPLTRDVALDVGIPVAIDPIDSSRKPFAVAVPSYIRIHSPASTWVIHGHSNTRGPFYTLLDSFIEYEVLVVPDAFPNERALPPYLLNRTTSNNARVTAQYLSSLANPLSLETGIAIFGHVTRENVPVEGAKVYFRSDPLFSTGESTDERGTYSIRVNPGGLFSITIAPPAGSSLPVARIDQGIVLSDPLAEIPPIDFNWSPNPTVDLTLNMRWNGEAAHPVTVLIESDETSLPHVGTLTVTGVFPASLRGYVRRSDSTDATGRVWFPQLPLAKYKLTAIPSSALEDRALTVRTLDVANAQSALAMDILLNSKVEVRGRLFARDRTSSITTAGTEIYVSELSSGIIPSAVTTTVSDAGLFSFFVDPDRTYRMAARPPQNQGFPEKTLLFGFTAHTGVNILDDQVLPKGVKLNGKVTFASQAVPGAIVQVFCLGQLPDCVDSTNRSVGSPPVLAQALTDPEGNYHVWLADPSSTE